MKASSAVVAVVLGLGALAVPAARAQSVVHARVLSATPAWESVPVTRCQPSGAGAAVGAVAGGLIGSQFGHGAGHAVGTILGAVGGAFIGNAIEADQRGCRTGYEQHLAGYDVSYELNGQVYRTRTAQDPGPWLQVPVAGGHFGPADAAGDAYGYGYGYGAPASAYPVAPPRMPGRGVPPYPQAGVVTAPRGLPQAYPQSYPPADLAPAPGYVMPVGVSLSIGGVIGGGRHGRSNWGMGIGGGW